MNKQMIRAIIIDDEEDARESLALALTKYCPQVELVARCEGPKIGLKIIKEEEPELVFLDVQMPHMSGFDLLEQIEKPTFQTIFVTAHDKYAIKAIRFSALDYLMKPVDIEELVGAVNRAHKINEKQDYRGILHNVRNRLGQAGKLAVPISEGMVFVEIKDIIHLQADGSYTRLFMEDRSPMLVSKRLKDFENILDPNYYCRIHHSSIINLAHVERYIQGEGGYVIMSNQAHVDVSRRKKEEFMKLIAKI